LKDIVTVPKQFQTQKLIMQESNPRFMVCRQTLCNSSTLRSIAPYRLYWYL